MAIHGMEPHGSDGCNVILEDEKIARSENLK
jgi:hypothetical protein